MTTVTHATPRSVLVPAGASAARLIVCERSGRWAVGLRRELASTGVRVWETRSPEACWQLLAAAPGSFAVAELTEAWTDALLERLARLEREFPLVQVAVVADRWLAGWEWLMREAGAVHFTCSPRRLGPLARLACRHLAEMPAPPRSLTERIWEGLPWGREERMKDEG